MKNNNQNTGILCSILSGTISLAILTLAFGHFWLEKYTTIFLTFLIGIILFVLFVAEILLSIMCLFFSIKAKQQDRFAYLPLLINLAVIIAILAIPFNQISSSIIYWKDIDNYLEVIEMVKDNTINGTGNFWHLPQEYKYLSKSGNIVVNETEEDLSIMFVVYDGFPQGLQGYIYTSSDKYPDKTFGYVVENIDKKSENWYWAELY